MKIFVVFLFLFAFIFIVAAAFPSQVQMYLGKIIALLSYREKTSFTGHFLIFLHGILTYSCCVDLEELLWVSIVLLYYSIQKEKNTPFLICGTYFWGNFGFYWKMSTELWLSFQLRPFMKQGTAKDTKGTDIQTPVLLFQIPFLLY